MTFHCRLGVKLRLLISILFFKQDNGICDCMYLVLTVLVCDSCQLGGLDIRQNL